MLNIYVAEIWLSVTVKLPPLCPSTRYILYGKNIVNYSDVTIIIMPYILSHSASVAVKLL